MNKGLAVESAQPARAPVRFELKARVVAAGYRHFSQFATVLGIDPSRLSRVLNGSEYPSRQLQRRFAEALGWTLAELGRLL